MKSRGVPYFIASRISLKSEGGFTSVIIKIAIATIALSLAVMIISTAVMEGFKNQITDKIFGFWGHIHITDANVNRSFELYPIKDDQSIRTQIEEIDFVEYYPVNQESKKRTVGGVKSVQSFIIYPAIIKTKDNFEGIIIKGIGADFNWSGLDGKIKKGTTIDLKQESPSREILLSEQTAARLNLEIGDRLILNFVKDRQAIKKRFEIKGIYRTGLEEYDKKIAFIDQRILRDVLNWSEDEIGGYEITLDEFGDSKILADYIYDEIIPATQYAETIREKFPNIFEWLDLQDINERTIIFLMILVSIINMATSLLILILERSKMIGILKTIGETNWNIRKIFLINAFYILTLGIFLGNLIGLGFAYLQKRFAFIKLDEANYYLSSAPIDITWWNVLSINLMTILVIMVFLLIPSFLVTKIKPIRHLHFG